MNVGDERPIRELKQPRRKRRRRRQVIAEGVERERRFWRENEIANARGRQRLKSCLFSLRQFKKWHRSETSKIFYFSVMDQKIIEDEEFLILYDLFEPRNPDFPHEAYAKFAKNINVLIFSSSLVFDLI